MTSVAPARFRVVLTEDPTTNELTEHRVFWPETLWTPTATPGVYLRGDQTVLSADGAITFLDCHVLPGGTHVLPFGEWTTDHVGVVAPTLDVEEHGPQGTVRRAVPLVSDGGVYVFEVAPTTQRVCLAV